MAWALGNTDQIAFFQFDAGALYADGCSLFVSLSDDVALVTRGKDWTVMVEICLLHVWLCLF